MAIVDASPQPLNSGNQSITNTPQSFFG